MRFGRVCVLIIMLLCAACNLQRQEEVASVPTPTLDPSPTQKATRTPISFGAPAGIPITQLAPAGTLLPPPLSISIATAKTSGLVNISASTTPDQAVRQYYALVSQRRYDLAWSMLNDSFKQKFNCCAPNYNYTDYVNWWNSVSSVEFGNVRTVSQSGDRAVVYVEMIYVMNDGRRSSIVGDPYIELVYDSSLNAWRFNDKRANA